MPLFATGQTLVTIVLKLARNVPHQPISAPTARNVLGQRFPEQSVGIAGNQRFPPKEGPGQMERQRSSAVRVRWYLPMSCAAHLSDRPGKGHFEVGCSLGQNGFFDAQILSLMRRQQSRSFGFSGTRGTARGPRWRDAVPTSIGRSKATCRATHLFKVVLLSTATLKPTSVPHNLSTPSRGPRSPAPLHPKCPMFADIVSPASGRLWPTSGTCVPERAGTTLTLATPTPVSTSDYTLCHVALGSQRILICHVLRRFTF